jgi:hypothetical protein
LQPLARTSRTGHASMDDEYAAVAKLQAIKRVEVPEDLIGTV